MTFIFKPSSDVRFLPQGPQSPAGARKSPVTADEHVYTIVRQMPIEADGRIRYRIRSVSTKTERVVTEEELLPVEPA